MSNTPIILTAVAADVVITTAALFWLLRRRGLIGSIGADLGRIRAFSESIQQPVASYLRANYGGDPETLPTVLEGLLGEIEAEAREQKLSLTREALKIIVLRIIAAQNEVPGGVAMTALKKVA